VIYFLRQGALTLVACFSGPPRQAQLDEGLRLLQLQETPAEDLLRDLPPDVAALAANLLNSPLERDLLLELWSYPRMAMQISGWAEQIGHGEDDVAGALANLERLGLVQSRYACGLTSAIPNEASRKGLVVPKNTAPTCLAPTPGSYLELLV
jgi:hypothetical protein